MHAALLLPLKLPSSICLAAGLLGSGIRLLLFFPDYRISLSSISICQNSDHFICLSSAVPCTSSGYPVFRICLSFPQGLLPVSPGLPALSDSVWASALPPAPGSPDLPELFLPLPVLLPPDFPDLPDSPPPPWMPAGFLLPPLWMSRYCLWPPALSQPPSSVQRLMYFS